MKIWKAYLSSVLLDGDLSMIVRCELYVPSSKALTGEVRPSMRSYVAEFKLILSLLIEFVGGIMVGDRRERAVLRDFGNSIDIVEFLFLFLYRILYDNHACARGLAHVLRRCKCHILKACGAFTLSDPITMTSAPKLEVDVVQGCVGVRSVSTASRSLRPNIHISVRGPGRLYARV